jgi:predicted metal-dependent phosphoesterase TrpH
MIPPAVPGEARNRSIDAIGIGDHNSAENVEAIKKAGTRFGVIVFGGMATTSRYMEHLSIAEVKRVLKRGDTRTVRR